MGDEELRASCAHEATTATREGDDRVTTCRACGHEVRRDVDYYL